MRPQRVDPGFVDVLDASLRRLRGTGLPGLPACPDAARWLYADAPYGLLAHDTAPDPLFGYANRTAQRLFGYEWDEFVGLPSRLSAGPADRDERARFLAAVARDGYAAGYRGLRVARSGGQFWIEDALVWNLALPDGTRVGQAALLPVPS